MKKIKTFETAEIPNPHQISVRALLLSEAVQFEHLSLESGQSQKRHVAHTMVYLYILNGTGTLEAGEETIKISADELLEICPETPHRLINTGDSQLRLLNIKAPPPAIATNLVPEGL